MLLGWGGLELKWYCFRLTTLGAFFYYFLAYPIAAFSYNPETQPVEAIICALVWKREQGTGGDPSALPKGRNV
jgi:hypothetical protein